MKRSFKLRWILCLAGACLVSAAMALAQDPVATKQEKENDKRIARMSLPTAVQKTVRAQSRGAVILEIARELANWKTVPNPDLARRTAQMEIRFDAG